MKRPSISRRFALKLLLGAPAALTLAPAADALAVTQSDIDKTEDQIADAKARYAEVEQQLEEISAEYEELSIQLSDTLERIDAVSAQIADTEEQIAQKEQELENKRTVLSQRARSAYKAGGDEVLSALLSASTFEEFTSNIYYLDKISANDARMIEDIGRLKEELELHRAELEASRAELEELRATQEAQLAQMQAKQDEVQEMLDGLDQDVQDLIAKRDEQLLELARERQKQKEKEEAARKAAEEAARKKAEEEAQAAAPGAANVTGDYQDGDTSGAQSRVVYWCKHTPTPGVGYCAMWVSQVFNNAGFSYAGGNANDMYNQWTSSSNRADLKTGMIIAVSTHSHTWAGRIYGHIGIYIGDGMMMDNVGYIRTISVNEWVNYYGTTVSPRWGWLMGLQLQ